MSHSELNNSAKEIDIFKILINLYKEKFLILLITLIFFLVGYFVTLNSSAPSYKVTLTFISPSTIQVEKVIQEDPSTIQVEKVIQGVKVTKNDAGGDIFSKFLEKLSLKSNQRAAFIEGDFISKFFPDYDSSNEPINFDSLLSSINLKRPDINSNDMNWQFADEKPYEISMVGSSPTAIKEFLIELIEVSDQKTFSDLREIQLIRMNAQIEQLTNYQKMKTEELNYMIQAEKNYTNELVENEINRLKESSELAQILGVTQNNFSEPSMDLENLNTPKNYSNLSPLQYGADWYLYGSETLDNMIDLLENKVNYDSFSSNLPDLNKQLFLNQNNPELSLLIAQKDRFELKLKNGNGSLKTVQILDDSLIEDLSYDNTKQILALSIFLGLFFAIALVLIKNAIKIRLDQLN